MAASSEEQVLVPDAKKWLQRYSPVSLLNPSSHNVL